MDFNKSRELRELASLARAKENLARMHYAMGCKTHNRFHFNEASKLRREKHAIIRQLG